MEETLSIPATRFWPRLSLLFWAAEGLGGVAAVVGGVYFAATGPWFVAAAMVLGGVVLVGAGAIMAGLSLAIVTARGPVLELSPAGLRDVRVSPDTIAWNDVEWGLVYAGKGTHSIQFRTPGPLRLTWPMRLLGPLNRLMGQPPYTIMTLGTGKSIDELCEILGRYRGASF